MWKDYSISSIKANRASSISIAVGVLIASLFLSFLCCMFYNFWLDDIEGIVLENGDWHGRIIGEISEEEIARISGFANVKKAIVNTELSDEKETVVDLSFYKIRTVQQDMTAIKAALGLDEEAVSYHYQLLSMYFVRIPGDDAPRLLMPMYLAIVLVVCFSMILIIRTSFAVSMNNRIRQFGILSSVGATPRQIRACLMQEAITLALLPSSMGILLGILLSLAAICGMNLVAATVAGGRQAIFHYHPMIFMLTFFASALTILFSAWLPARKLSRVTTLEAIRGTDELQLKKKRRSRILSALFGIEGELAGNALKAQKRALRTSALSLTLAFLGFMVMECFFTLSGISTNHTYFEKYQNVWDIMVTVKNTRIEDVKHVSDIQNLPEVSSGVVYQMANAMSILPEESISKEILNLGGLEALAGSSVLFTENTFHVRAPVVIMDDESFAQYCTQIGIVPDLSGSILLNRIWDSINSVFRDRKFVSYVEGSMSKTVLENAANREKTVEIPVLAYTQQVPVLREQYDDYVLVHFVSLSLWKEIEGTIGGTQSDTTIRLLAKERDSLEELNWLEEHATELLASDHIIESENRIQEKISNDEIIGAYEFVMGAFCVLLAFIGIVSVFSNTLGFLRQRKREFARYMSIGLTPKGLQKMFCIEAMMIAGRPLLYTLPVTIAVAALMITASYLDPMEFIAVAPIVPIAVFILAVFAFVALAYYIGAKQVLKSNLVETLRDNTAI